MIWIIFALISALSQGVQGVLHKYIMLTEDPYSYALLENLLTALVFIPVLFMEFVFPTNAFAWMLVFISSVFWVFIAVIGFKAYKLAEASVKSIISQSRILFLFIFSVVLLSESFTVEKVIGIMLIFLGLVVLTYKKKKRFGTLRDRGVQLAFLGAFLSACVALVDKKALDYFTPGTLGFLVYFIPAIILIIFGRHHFHDVKKIWKTKKPYLFSVIVLGFVFYYFKLKAYTLTDVSNAFPIVRLSTLFTVIGAMIFLKERQQLSRKLICVFITLIGVILISGYYSLF